MNPSAKKDAVAGVATLIVVVIDTAGESAQYGYQPMVTNPRNANIGLIGAKIEISGKKWVEKTPIYIFSTFGSKINEFERKKSEKNKKIPKT